MRPLNSSNESSRHHPAQLIGSFTTLVGCSCVCNVSCEIIRSAETEVPLALQSMQLGRRLVSGSYLTIHGVASSGRTALQIFRTKIFRTKIFRTKIFRKMVNHNEY